MQPHWLCLCVDPDSSEHKLHLTGNTPHNLTHVESNNKMSSKQHRGSCGRECRWGQEEPKNLTDMNNSVGLPGGTGWAVGGGGRGCGGKDMTQGGEHTTQCTDHVLWNREPEACVIFLTSVAPIVNIKENNKTTACVPWAADEKRAVSGRRACPTPLLRDGANITASRSWR